MLYNGVIDYCPCVRAIIAYGRRFLVVSLVSVRVYYRDDERGQLQRSQRRC